VAAKVVELCDEIVAFLNMQGFSPPLAAERRNVLFDDLEAMTGLQVVVLPGDSETAAETRQSSSRRYRVNIVVQKRLDQMTELAEQDELLELAEAIEEELYGESMGTFGFDSFSETAGSRLLIDAEAMARLRVFRTVLQVTYLGG
jgi:hypothetical protein